MVKVINRLLFFFLMLALAAGASYNYFMPLPDAREVLPDYEVSPDQIFDVLNDKERGVALVPMPDGINPQALVDSFAEVIAEGLYDRSYFYSFERHPEDMPTIGNDPELSASMADEFSTVFGAVRRMVAEGVLPHSQKSRFGSTYHRLVLNGADLSSNRQPHRDHSMVTAYLGSNNYGHVEDLPGHGWTPIDRLPDGYVLLSTQREWCHGGADFAFTSGREHFVDWEPASDTDFRVVGLDFIG